LFRDINRRRHYDAVEKAIDSPHDIGAIEDAVCALNEKGLHFSSQFHGGWCAIAMHVPRSRHEPIIEVIQR